MIFFYLFVASSSYRLHLGVSDSHLVLPCTVFWRKTALKPRESTFWLPLLGKEWKKALKCWEILIPEWLEARKASSVPLLSLENCKAPIATEMYVHQGNQGIRPIHFGHEYPWWGNHFQATQFTVPDIPISGTIREEELYVASVTQKLCGRFKIVQHTKLFCLCNWCCPSQGQEMCLQLTEKKTTKEHIS